MRQTTTAFSELSKIVLVQVCLREVDLRDKKCPKKLVMISRLGRRLDCRQYRRASLFLHLLKASKAANTVHQSLVQR